MNPNYRNKVFPELVPLSFEKNFPPGTPKEALSFLKHLLVYNPKNRPRALEALAHPYFRELTDAVRVDLPGNQGPMPSEMFNFTQSEYNYAANVIEETSLIPEWLPPTWMTSIDRYAKSMHPTMRRKPIEQPEL